jgi:hypothetical protein
MLHPSVVAKYCPKQIPKEQRSILQIVAGFLQNGLHPWLEFTLLDS